MKTPKPKGTPIDAKRVRRWTDAFASYRYAVTDATITDWIAQFGGQRDTAARLLDVVDFYNSSRVHSAFRTALESLPGWSADPALRKGRWRICSFSTSSGQSGDSMLHHFRVTNQLDKKKYDELFIHPSQIVLQKLGPDDTLLLIDDFVGTGKQACTAWNEYFAELAAGIGNVYLVVVAAINTGRDLIRQKTEMTCVAAHYLTPADNVFENACNNFSTAEKSEILKNCKKANNKEPKGYGDCGLVIVFQHRCPNNTIPIFHMDHNHWTALFPRHG